MASIHLERVTMRFKEVVALKKVSATIESGEIFGILGPSGCGKSTLLRVICGLYTPTEGSVHLNSVDVTRVRPKDRNIMLVPQTSALIPHMSVAENIGYQLKVDRVPPRERTERIVELASMLQIEDLLDREPEKLSGGEGQRVSIARALAAKPDILLFDEPLSSLDAQLREKLRDELRGIVKKSGATGVFVTHDQTEAMIVCDRIAIMSDGEILQVGTYEGVYDQPTVETVASMIGSPRINLIAGTICGSYLDTEDLRFSLHGDLPFECVRVGIRPEDIHIGEKEGLCKARARVLDVKSLGRHERLVELMFGTTTLRAHTSKEVIIGEEVWCTFTGIHLFDQHSRKHLCRL